MISCAPALERKPAIDLLREMAEGELPSGGISEDVAAQLRRPRADGRPPRDPPHLDATAAGVDRRTRVRGGRRASANRQQPSLYQTRMNSRAWTQVWEGPRTPWSRGGKWEQIIRSP